MVKLYTVMIVDDEPAIRFGIKNAVEWEDLSCEIVALSGSGIEALQTIRKMHPSIVITDIMMPGLSGLDLIRETQSFYPDTKFIILSGYDDFAYAKEAITLGVVDFLLKPLSKKELLAALKKTIGHLRKEGQRLVQDATQESEMRLQARTLFLQQLATGEIRQVQAFSDAARTFHLSSSMAPCTVFFFQLSNQDVKLDDFLNKNALLLHGDWWKQNALSCLFMVNGLEQTLLHEATIMAQQLEEQNLSAILGVGSIVASPLEIASSIQQALFALSYRLYDHKARLFTQSSIVSCNPTYLSNDIDRRDLEQILFHRKSEDLHKWVDSFFQKMLSTMMPPPNYLRGMCVFLLTDISKSVLRESNSTHIDQLSDFSEIYRIMALDELKEYVYHVLENLQDNIIPQATADNDPLIHQAKMLVDDAINVNMTAQEIADRLHMNFTYFSTYFKEKTGENFRVYLQNKKDAYAKRLLSDPQLSIEDVSAALGYADYRCFCRNFKKTNGTTPSQYKKELQK